MTVLLTTVCFVFSCNKDTKWVEDIYLDPSTLILKSAGAQFKLETLIVPIDASNKNVKWSSDKESVASVSSSGLVTAVSEGIAIISVETEDGNLRRSCTVKVDYSIYTNKLTLTHEEYTLKALGETVNLGVFFDPTNVTNNLVLWSSSNPRVATVNQDGTVTAIAPGEADITAISDDVLEEATCKVHVQIAVTGVEIVENFLLLMPNITLNLSAAVVPGNAFNQELEWTSENPSIATVDNEGKVVTVTGKAVGTTKIKVRSVDGNKEQTCDVRVIATVSAGGTLYEVKFDNGVPEGMIGEREGSSNATEAYSENLKTEKVEGLDALWLNFMWPITGMNAEERYDAYFKVSLPDEAIPYLRISRSIEVDYLISDFTLNGSGVDNNYGEFRFQMTNITYRSDGTGSSSFPEQRYKPIADEAPYSKLPNLQNVGDFWKFTYKPTYPSQTDFSVSTCSGLNIRIGAWGVWVTDKVYISSIRITR